MIINYQKARIYKALRDNGLTVQDAQIVSEYWEHGYGNHIPPSRWKGFVQKVDLASFMSQEPVYNSGAL